MNTKQFNEYLKNYQLWLMKLVMVLTAIAFIFSGYLTSLFWSNFGEGMCGKVVFIGLGTFLEIVKFCSGLTLIYALFSKKQTIKYTSFLILMILSFNSGVASISTISDRIGRSKEISIKSNDLAKQLMEKINQQKHIINTMVFSQEEDVNNGYRARANETLLRIKAEQLVLDEYENKLNNLANDEFAITKISTVTSDLLGLDQKSVEKDISILLSVLLELISLFLLFLTHAIIDSSLLKEKNDLEVNNKNDNNMVLPINDDEFKVLTEKIKTGKIKPTQRSIKQQVKLGNEKIAQLFLSWVNDGVLVKNGRGYAIA